MDRHALKIDLFFPAQDPTGEIALHTEALAQALMRKGTKVRVLKPQKLDFKGFFEDIKAYKPDYTLSFNGVLPSQDGLFLCDILQVPHIAYLTEYPLYFVDLIRSPLNHFFAQDKASVRFLEGTGAPKAQFVPCGVEKNLAPPIDEKKEIPILCWLSSLSFEHLLEEWQGHYTDEIIAILKAAGNYALFDPKMDLAEALSLGLQATTIKNGLILEELEPLSLLLEIEKYVACLGSEKLLESLAGLNVTIMAQKSIPTDLPEKFPHFNHVPEGDIRQYISLLAKSKMALVPEFVLKESIPFRLLSALALEVIPIAFQTDYLKEVFPDGEFMPFSRSTLPNLKRVIEEKLLAYESQETVIHKNRDKVLRLHSWDARAEEFLKLLHV